MDDGQTTFDVVLASGSPRRRDLLREAGVSFRVRTPRVPVDESLEPDDVADPHAAAKKLAERKAKAVVEELLTEGYVGTAAVLGSDTMVVCDGRILGKPRDRADAARMLSLLSGRSHEVVTSVSVWLVAAQGAATPAAQGAATPAAQEVAEGGAAEGDVSLGFRTFADASQVTFHALSSEDIEAYLDEGESFDKAGAYAIQGAGARLVERVEGSMSTVIGLPVERLLREFGDVLAPGRPGDEPQR